MDLPLVATAGTVAGLGVDLVDIAELEAIIARRGDRFLQRVFTGDEVAYCQSKHRAAQHYSARFAAKEAAFKALGTGWAQGVTWKDVEVHVPQWGSPPVLRFTGEFARRMRRGSIDDGRVSLSHSRASAVAIVLLLRRSP